MPTSSLLALIDDIGLVLEDVAILSKVAAKKTAGVLGDDLALNAQQVSGLDASRELPVVWEVTKGSARNKAILVPAALAISAVVPWAVTPLLMIGGLYLCFEGFEKIAHQFLHSKEEDAAAHAETLRALSDPSVDLVALERERIKGAVRTDFVLSAEIIAITLGTVAEASFTTRLLVLVVTAIAMTLGVYGLVACIVKLDDLGLSLSRRGGPACAIGRAILAGAPYLMKGLSVLGTAAMFMVGGGILTHGIGPLHHWAAHLAGPGEHLSTGAAVLRAVGLAAYDAVVGLIAGALTLGVVMLAKRFLPKKKATPTP
jgi:hypothetical protein